MCSTVDWVVGAGVQGYRPPLCGDAARVAGGLGEGTRGHPEPGLQRTLLAQIQVPLCFV